MNRSDRLDLMFAALADPTRRAILSRLASGEATVNDLAKPFDMSQPAVSKHLKVLERAGLVSTAQIAQSRPRKIEAKGLKEIADWTNDYRKFWDASYARLDSYLETLKKKEKADDKRSNKR